MMLIDKPERHTLHTKLMSYNLCSGPHCVRPERCSSERSHVRTAGSAEMLV